jgi:hypothetical protein
MHDLKYLHIIHGIAHSAKGGTTPGIQQLLIHEKLSDTCLHFKYEAINLQANAFNKTSNK